MDSFKWCLNYVIRDCFRNSNLAANGYTFDGFEKENFSSSIGFNSNAIFGYIVYTDKFGKRLRSQSMVIKLTPNPKQRSKYTEITFSNEIFMYTRIIPFYGTLNNSILSIFPKFYYGSLALGHGDNENMSIILENLFSAGYRNSTSKVFLDTEHLFLMMKKLGEFHSYSYYAKNKHPRTFYSYVDNLVETHFTCTRDKKNYLDKVNNHFMELLKQDEKYGSKVETIRELLKDAHKFMEEVFTNREEPVSVLCHGDFLRNNVMFKYDEEEKPVAIKFLDLPCAKYCTPVVDLALVLYMNTDQKTRDKYWDDLLDVYYDAVKNTFPDNEVPSKNAILSEFKQKCFNGYLLIAFFLPRMLFTKESGCMDDAEYFYPEYVDYVDMSWYHLPSDISFKIIQKMLKPEHENVVLDVLKDIIDRGFI